MINLLQQKPYNEIKISDIVKEAKINRSSYYYHFYDKYDVIKLIINDICDDILSDVSNSEIVDLEYEREQRINELIRFKNKYAEIQILCDAGFQIDFFRCLYQILFDDRYKRSYAFLNQSTGKVEVLSNGLLYDIKITESVFKQLADIQILMGYNLELPFDQFLDLTKRAENLRFISGKKRPAPATHLNKFLL